MWCENSGIARVPIERRWIAQVPRRRKPCVEETGEKIARKKFLLAVARSAARLTIAATSRCMRSAITADCGGRRNADIEVGR
jgi:hypothetical protein